PRFPRSYWTHGHIVSTKSWELELGAPEEDLRPNTTGGAHAASLTRPHLRTLADRGQLGAGAGQQRPDRRHDQRRTGQRAAGWRGHDPESGVWCRPHDRDRTRWALPVSCSAAGHLFHHCRTLRIRVTDREGPDDHHRSGPETGLHDEN